MITMRIPQQVSERVKEAPAQALRAVFSGIGQVLLVADRIKTRATEPARSQPGATQRQDQPRQSAPIAPKDESRWRSLDETGNVRLLSHDDASQPAAPPAPEPVASAEPAATPEAVAAAEPAAAPEPADSEPAAPEPAAEAGPDQAALPVPNYDGLTVASLRARLRNLDSAQVRELLDYEKANAGRAAVLTMFERRIAKLESLEA
jgi:hypothetical protein